MKAVDPRVSFAELQQWPDDGRRYELYDGEVIVVPAPFGRHQRVAIHLIDALLGYERATGGIVVHAPYDIVFSEHNVVQPDVVFFRRERRHLVPQWEANRVAPDLVVEVLSRSTEARDRGRKMAMFARFGVPECWIVDPSRNMLEMLVLSGSEYDLRGTFGDGDVVTSVTLPDLTFEAARIFAE